MLDPLFCVEVETTQEYEAVAESSLMMIGGLFVFLDTGRQIQRKFFGIRYCA